MPNKICSASNTLAFLSAAGCFLGAVCFLIATILACVPKVSFVKLKANSRSKLSAVESFNYAVLADQFSLYTRYWTENQVRNLSVASI